MEPHIAVHRSVGTSSLKRCMLWVGPPNRCGRIACRVASAPCITRPEIFIRNHYPYCSRDKVTDSPWIRVQVSLA